jgi:hypothetical protein
MSLNTRRMIGGAALLLYVGTLWGWFLGRGAGAAAGVEIRRSPTRGWIEIYRGGKLESEWNELRDPDVWQPLDRIYRNDPSLYLSPAPDRALRGRGPVLGHQEARLP